MKSVLCLLMFATIVGITFAYWIDSNDLLAYPDEDDSLDTMSAVKRGNCMRWGMVCIPNGRYKFSECCGGLNCMCNFWKTHCRCRARLG